MQTSALSSSVGGAALLLFACSRGTDSTGSADAGATVLPARPAAAGGDPASLSGSARAARFPATALTAKAQQFALVPLKNAIDLALRAGDVAPTFLYVGAHVLRVGQESSEVRWLSQQRAVVPNAFVVPIRSGERARRGDVVLTNFASGSGLQRGFVVSEGESATPRVRYLDLAVENPTGWAGQDETLPADSFHVLRAPGEVGTTLACKLDGRVERVVVTLVHEQRRLGLGFAGALRDVDANACVALPLVPEVRAGDSVFVPWLGAFTGAKVTSVDTGTGRIRVRFDFGAEARETQVGFTNVATALP